MGSPKKIVFLLLTLVLLFFTGIHFAPSAVAERILQPKSKSSPTAVSAATPQGFQDTQIFTGLSNPTNFRFAKDGRIFIAEKSGIIKEYDNLTDTTPTTVADLRTEIMDYWDRGLLGLELDPNFPTNPYIYVLYTLDAPLGGTPPVFNDACSDPTGAGCVVAGRLARITINGNTMVPGSEKVLIENWCQQYPSHSVGNIRFGVDGALYVSGGEGANFNDVDYGQFGNPCNDPVNEGGALRAQDIRTTADPTAYNGTILRVDANGNALTTNPLYGGTKTDDDRIIAYGFRNPFKFTFRPGTSEIWVGDVGWNTWEEINRILSPTATPITDFGWPCYEGNAAQSAYQAANLAICQNLYTAGTAQAPYYTYIHNGTSSVTGLAFYQGTTYPANYKNALFFSDYSQGWIKVMLPGGNGLPDPNNITTFADTGTNAIDLETGPNNDVFYLNFTTGELHRIAYSATNNPPVARIKANKTYGATPLKVTFDASSSSDPDGDTISYSWDLNGDGKFADSTATTPTHTYKRNRNYTVSLKVTDSKGASATTSTVIYAGDTPPAPKITAPAATYKYKVGDVIQYTGSATDPESGTLSPSTLTWDIVLYHCAVSNPEDCHQHPLQQVTGAASGSFTAPDHEYPSHIEVTLTATDNRGLSSSTTLAIYPQTVTLTFQTNPSGLQLTFYGTSTTTPFTRDVVVNSTTSISAPTPQTLGDTSYTFSSWSDGGAQTHDITASATPTTYTATFIGNGGPTPVLWHSYDVVTQAGSPQGIVKDATGTNQATIQFYQSTNLSGVDQAGLFTTYNAGLHPDPFNHVQNYWANATGATYPYAGKSSIERGSDTGESNTPQPLGVNDLQLHPSDTDYLTVAAFVVPQDGTYSVKDLSVRRVDGNTGQSVRYKVFNAQKTLIDNLQATNQAWVNDTTTYNLGALKAGDKIYFAVDRDGAYYYDATEVAWTILMTPQTTANTTWNSYDVITQAGSPQATVKDTTGANQATVQLYESSNVGGVDLASLFSTYNAIVHPDPFNKVQNYWANATGATYPYAGKSTVARGNDLNETNAPQPSGVFDLQLHPSDTDNLAVAAFVVPVSGTYTVSNLATRRVDGNVGQTSRFKVFTPAKTLTANIQTGSQAWTTDGGTYNLGALNAGDKIYFAVDRDGAYYYDATEIVWRITKQ